jgi:hypothetical protein
MNRLLQSLALLTFGVATLAACNPDRDRTDTRADDQATPAEPATPVMPTPADPAMPSDTLPPPPNDAAIPPGPGDMPPSPEMDQPPSPTEPGQPPPPNS